MNVAQHSKRQSKTHLEMSLLENVLGVKHDGVDSCHLLKNHQHYANGQGLVDATVHQVGQLEIGALAAAAAAASSRR